MVNIKNIRVNKVLDDKVNKVLRELNIACDNIIKSNEIDDKIMKISNLKHLLFDLPEVTELISMNTIAKLIDISNRFSIDIWGNDSVTVLDYAIFEAAGYSTNREQILKSFFMKKEGQILKFMSKISTECYGKDFVLNMKKIAILNKLIKDKNNIEEKKRLSTIFSLRGLTTDENKLFRVIAVSKDKMFKKNTMVFEIASLNLYALINNVNNLKAIEMSDVCIKSFIEGYKKGETVDDKKYIQSIDIKKDGSLIEIEMIIRNDLNKQVCEIFAEKIKDTLRNTEHLINGNMQYDVFDIAGQEFLKEIRDIIREILLKDKLSDVVKEDVVINGKKKI